MVLILASSLAPPYTYDHMKILSKNEVKSFLYSFRPLRRVGYWLGLLADPMFKEVEIETTSACNRNCAYCPVSINRRPAKLMEEALFKKIVGDLRAINYKRTLFFCFYSEPLLDKRLFAFLQHAREQLPGATLEIYTNGDLLDFEKFSRLVDAGADYIKVSRHDREPAPEFLKMLEAVKGSRYAKNLVVFERDEEQELSNRGGAVYVKHHGKINYCNFKRLTIDVDGNVILCCMDYYSTHRFGNAATQNLMDIWNDKAYRDVRRRYWSGLWPYEICRVCSGDSPSPASPADVTAPPGNERAGHVS